MAKEEKILFRMLAITFGICSIAALLFCIDFALTILGN